MTTLNISIVIGGDQAMSYKYVGSRTTRKTKRWRRTCRQLAAAFRIHGQPEQALIWLKMARNG